MCGRWDQPMYQSRCKLTYDLKKLAIFTKKNNKIKKTSKDFIATIVWKFVKKKNDGTHII